MKRPCLSKTAAVAEGLDEFLADCPDVNLPVHARIAALRAKFAASAEEASS